MNHPKCGPKSNLAHNTSAYLKFGLPRVVARSGREESSGYDSSNDGSPVMRSKNLLSRSDPDFRKNLIQNPSGGNDAHKSSSRERRMKSISEANLLSGNTIDYYHLFFFIRYYRCLSVTSLFKDTVVNVRNVSRLSGKCINRPR